VALDEGRFGLITWLRRRWCPLGERPPWIVQDEYEWLWLYAAVEPTTGTGVFLLLPTVEGQCLSLFSLPDTFLGSCFPLGSKDMLMPAMAGNPVKPAVSASLRR
jgi:hypothetical protein